MRNVYMVADNIFSPLGKNTSDNMEALKNSRSGIQQHHSEISAHPFYASLFSPEDKEGNDSITAFERIILNSAFDAIRQFSLEPADKKNGFILSSTKGNISLIEKLVGKSLPADRLSMNTSAEIISKKLGFVSDPLVVSHACISGLLALITGMRLIQTGKFENLVISGGDLISSFIYSGFQSFQAISSLPCKPFDAARDGISLGEAAATIILSSVKTPESILLNGGAISNDANHISGPSRTGEELFLAISSALRQAGVSPNDIDFISAHGTATRYNDEMEAKAFHLAGMEKVPVNSFKGYYGHTLGAAGILETVITAHSMKENIILPSFGFTNPGTEMPVHIIKELSKARLKTCLKTASGFGGCNAALIIVSC
jgi:3-oxoacyl-[acyl-carrier-protein] synthase-1